MLFKKEVLSGGVAEDWVNLVSLKVEETMTGSKAARQTFTVCCEYPPDRSPLYDRWEAICGRDPVEILAVWKALGELGIQDQLHFERFQIADELFRLLEESGIQYVQSNDNVAISTHDLVTTISGNRWDIQMCFRGAITTNPKKLKTLRLVYDQFCHFEIGADRSRDFSLREAMEALSFLMNPPPREVVAAEWWRVKNWIEKPEFETVLETRFFPTTGSRLIPKARREWKDFWQPVIAMAHLVRASQKLARPFFIHSADAALRNNTGKFDKDISELLQFYRPEDAAATALIEGWKTTVHQAAREYGATKSFAQGNELWHGPTMGDASTEQLSQIFSQADDPLGQLRALRDMTRGTLEPLKSAFEQVLRSAQGRSLPTHEQKVEFANLINELLEIHACRLRAPTTGERARLCVYRKSQSISHFRFQVTGGLRSGAKDIPELLTVQP
jgi:hypothetical protein